MDNRNSRIRQSIAGSFTEPRTYDPIQELDPQQQARIRNMKDWDQDAAIDDAISNMDFYPKLKSRLNEAFQTYIMNNNKRKPWNGISGD